jgi:hypothetical protein
MYGSVPPSAFLRSRLLQAIVVCAALAGLIQGCADPRVIEIGVPAAPPVQARQSCTAQWHARGHTTQAEAQLFARKCLYAQGVVGKQLDVKIVTRKLTALLEADQPLTALEPSDIATFCPGYMQQDRNGRAVFWRTALAVLAGPESVYNTAATYWEADQGQYAIGLLQLTLADVGRYRCGFKSEVDITDPNRNLACGIKIVTQLVGEDGMIGGDAGHETKGAGAYWQNLRHPSAVRAGLINATRAIAVCKR